MKNILLVRSAPHLQLENNLSSIKNMFPNSIITLIENDNSVSVSDKYLLVDKINIYPHKGHYQFSKKISFDENEDFDESFVMIRDKIGYEQFNIFSFGLSLPTKRLWAINCDSQITQCHKSRLWKLLVFRYISKLTLVLLSKSKAAPPSSIKNVIKPVESMAAK